MKHQLPAGMAMIEALLDLGACLSYEAQSEHRVGKGSDVDVSWTAAGQNDVPLFIFEVESSPSAGLANNAQKVYGRSTEELGRPLFFFHVVMSGRPDNDRISAAQRAWGQHNYRVYRANATEDRQSLLGDILRQHRRVQRRLSIQDLLQAVEGHAHVWGEISTPETLHLAEELNFAAPYLEDYTWWALRDPRGLQMLVSRLAALDADQSGRLWESEVGFTGGLGAHSYGGLLEVSARLLAGGMSDEEGPRAFERWATRSGLGMRTIGPYFGLNRDYDLFIIGFAAREYAIAAGPLADYPASRDWIIHDLDSLLLGMQRTGLPPALCAPTAIWLAHVVASTRLGGHSARSGTKLTDEDLDAIFRRASEAIDSVGGVTLNQVIDPPMPGADDSVLTVVKEFDARGGSPLPPRDSLRTAIARYTARDVEALHAPGALVLASLVDDSWLLRADQILAQLYPPR